MALRCSWKDEEDDDLSIGLETIDKRMDGEKRNAEYNRKIIKRVIIQTLSQWLQR